MDARHNQCPKRGPGLSHTVDGTVFCVHCQVMTYVLPGVPKVTLVSTERPPRLCESCKKHPAERRQRLCADCILHRRVLFTRFRYEAGDITEDGPFPPIRPEPVTKVGHGSLDDWSAESIAKAVGQ